MSQVQRDHEQRIVDALEEHREQLEDVAASETSFAPRAQSALDWLEEHTEGDNGE